jgi:hypothetical protein
MDMRSENMKTYTFPWQCDEAWGEIEMEVTDEEIELMKDAYRDSFECLEDEIYLADLRERTVSRLSFYDPAAGQDIRIYFPDEITEEVDDE